MAVSSPTDAEAGHACLRGSAWCLVRRVGVVADAFAFPRQGHPLRHADLYRLGERAHLLNPGIDLNTHIEDIVQVIEHEDLSDVVLVGHSYGGMVATGVAARVANRIRRLIYVDALLPEPGECALDLLLGYRVRACWKPRSRRDSGG
ncbi:alpha/beta fold hydrolase [Cupriavidus sp. USMAA2-4]|uniref:alpha/beta fold hydrolase n=1 Tax=Cupriavidus sp. USMAA2-4 TaxID=876364 RepID=UPI001E493774|nr:alpha/beta fold hydrolase [Cupriavidus sp. USMAA2-4]